MGLNKSEEDFSIVKVSRGSVDIQVSYSSTGQSDAETVSTSTNLNTLSGMNVISSSVSMYYQDGSYEEKKEGPPKKKQIIGLIIGIIAGVIVVGAIIGLLIYKLKNKD